MRNVTIFCLVLCIALIHTGLSKAEIVWIGSGANPNQIFLDTNWDLTNSPANVVNQNRRIGDDIQIIGATINATDFTNFGAIVPASGFTLTFDSTTFVSNARGGVRGVNGGAQTMVNLINNSDIELQFVSRGTDVSIDGTSTLTLRGNGDPINSSTEPTNIFLESGATLRLRTLAEFTEQGDEIFGYNAAGELVSYNSDNSILSFSGTSATAVFAAVPEPGSFCLLASVLIFLSKRRRSLKHLQVQSPGSDVKRN